MPTPETRMLSLDINALEGRLRKLQDMRREIASPPAVLVMGPGGRGRAALNALGATGVLETLIRLYEMAIRDLVHQHTAAEITECTRSLFAAHGPERADVRRYLRDLIAELAAE